MKRDAKVIAMIRDLDSMALFNLLADNHNGEMRERLASLALSAYDNDEISGDDVIAAWNDTEEAA